MATSKDPVQPRPESRRRASTFVGVNVNTFGQDTYGKTNRDQDYVYKIFHDKNSGALICYNLDDLNGADKPGDGVAPAYVFNWKSLGQGSFSLVSVDPATLAGMDLSDTGANCTIQAPPVSSLEYKRNNLHIAICDQAKDVLMDEGDPQAEDDYKGNEFYQSIKSAYKIASTKVERRKFILSRDSSGKMLCYDHNDSATPLFQVLWAYDGDGQFDLKPKDVPADIDKDEFDIDSQIFEVDVTDVSIKDDILSHLKMYQPNIAANVNTKGKPTSFNIKPKKITPAAVAATATASSTSTTSSATAPNAGANNNGGDNKEKLEDFLFHAARNIAHKKFMTKQLQEEEQRKIRAQIEMLRYSKWNQRWKKFLMFFGIGDGMYFAGLLGGLAEAPEQIMSPAAKTAGMPTSIFLFSIAVVFKAIEFIGRIGDTVTSKNINIGKIKTLLIPVLELAAMGVAIYGGQTFLASIAIKIPALHLSAVAAPPLIFAGLLGTFTLYHLGMAIWLGVKSGDEKKYSKHQRKKFALEASIHAQKSITFGIVTAALTMMMIFAKMLPGAAASSIHLLGATVPVLPLMAAAVVAFAVINLINTVVLVSQWATSTKNPEKRARLGREALVSFGKTLMYVGLAAGLIALCVFGGPLGAAALCGIGAAMTIGVPLLFEFVIPKIVTFVKESVFGIKPAPKPPEEHELEVLHNGRKYIPENDKEARYSKEAREMENSGTLAKQQKGWDFHKHADIQSTGLSAKHTRNAFADLEKEIRAHKAIVDKLDHKGPFSLWGKSNDKYGALKFLEAYKDTFFDIVNNTQREMKGNVSKLKITIRYCDVLNGDPDDKTPGYDPQSAHKSEVDFWYTDLNDLTEQVDQFVVDKFPRAYQSTLQFVGKVQSNFRQAHDILLTMNKVKELDPQGLEDEFKIRPQQKAALGGG